MAKHTYDVIVGNIGRVHTGNNRNSANVAFVAYRRQSLKGIGRAAAEAVTILCDGDVIRAYDPSPKPAQDDAFPESYRRAFGAGQSVATTKRLDDPRIVVAGNPVDGFTFHGPFDGPEAADAWAEDMQDDWWMAKLTAPTVDTTETETESRS